VSNRERSTVLSLYLRKVLSTGIEHTPTCGRSIDLDFIHCCEGKVGEMLYKDERPWGLRNLSLSQLRRAY
jgi:hypothetical protein